MSLWSSVRSGLPSIHSTVSKIINIYFCQSTVLVIALHDDDLLDSADVTGCYPVVVQYFSTRNSLQQKRSVWCKVCSARLTMC